MSKGGVLSGVYKVGRLAEFFDDSLCELAAFATITCHTSFCLDIGETISTTAANVADLVVGYLAANTNVHRLVSELLQL